MQLSATLCLAWRGYHSPSLATTWCHIENAAYNASDGATPWTCENVKTVPEDRRTDLNATQSYDTV